MTIISKNMEDCWNKNPPKTKNCKYCGAEAFLGGQPLWERWEHFIECSKNCQNSKKITSGTNSIESIIEKWNNINSQTTEQIGDEK